MLSYQVVTTDHFINATETLGDMIDSRTWLEPVRIVWGVLD